MSRWLSLCNGGPNNATVGKTVDSLGKAIGNLEKMMKNLGATVGWVEMLPDDAKDPQVATEAEASKIPDFAVCEACGYYCEDAECCDKGRTIDGPDTKACEEFDDYLGLGVKQAKLEVE